MSGGPSVNAAELVDVTVAFGGLLRDRILLDVSANEIVGLDWS